MTSALSVMGFKQNNVLITVVRPDGSIRLQKNFHNITCDAGREDMLARLGDFNTSGTSFKGVARYIAIGTGSPTVATSDTQLTTEYSRAAIDPTNTTQSGTSLTFSAKFPVGSAVTITEAGVFTGDAAATGANTGALLSHLLISPSIVKASDEAIILQWTITLNNG